MNRLCVMFSLALLALQANPALAKSRSEVSSVLGSYVLIQEALASDQIEDAKSFAEELAASASKLKDPSIDSKAVQAAARKVAEAGSIADARAAFKPLSATVANWVKKTKPKGYDVMTCSMADGKWVQKSGKVRNPYYGKEMLECGERER